MNLLDELFATLVSLPAALPPDLIKVHLDHSRGHGCPCCRFREGARVDVCGCQREAELAGAEGVATSSIWTAMALGVRAVGAKRDGRVYVGIGVDPEGVEWDYPRPFIQVLGSVGGPVEVLERWPAGFLRAVLLASIFEEALACGTTAVTHDGYGRFFRADNAALLADCNVDRMFGMRSPANPTGQGR